MPVNDAENAPQHTVKRARGRPSHLPPVPKTCLHCGATFLAPATKRDLHHFCSDRCRWGFHEAKNARLTSDDPTLAAIETPQRVADAIAAGSTPHQAPSPTSEAPQTAPPPIPPAPAPAAAPPSAAPADLEKAVGRAMLVGKPLSPAMTARIRGRIAMAVSENIDLAASVVEGKVAWTPTQARVFGMLLNKVVPDLSASHVTHEQASTDLQGMSIEQLERIAAGLDDIATIDGDADDVTPPPPSTTPAKDPAP